MRTVTRYGEEKMIFPGLEQLESAREEYDLAMVTLEARSDLETPVSAFMKLKGEGPGFVLESAEKGETWGRYSFLGFEDMVLARAHGGTLSVVDGRGEVVLEGDPVKGLFEYIEGTRVLLPGLPVPFAGGAVGYFGYDIITYLDKVELSGEAGRLPQMMFMVPRRMVVFDHLFSKMYLGVLLELSGETGDIGGNYREAAGELTRMYDRLHSPLDGIEPLAVDSTSVDLESIECNMNRPGFEGMVDRAREYIGEGDAFQIVVSQRYSIPLESEPFSIYRCLRSENPSTYMFYLDLPGVCLIGSSPEPMVTNRGGSAVIRPIAGTRPRGSSEEDDEILAAELISDPKERAEHIMLVDLARNDLGRVCAPGTVKVTRMLEVERYSHVMHLVSQVEGVLSEGMGNYELLRASFPAGTVSGAPKVRACQIIDELEPDRRGVYAGAVGYLSYTGDMDTCIAIRTVVVEDGSASVQAGAGIVADSVPADEWAESRYKALALVRAVKAAGRGAG